MTKPVRITYRENVDHFIDAQNNAPAQKAFVIPEKIQNAFIALLIIGTLLYVIVEEYREKGEVIIPLLASGAALAIMGFWFWLFSKLRWFRKQEPQKYQWTEKDRIRFEKNYLKVAGRPETVVVCEFNDDGFMLIPDQGEGTNFRWSSMVRVIEVPQGLFVYIGRRLFHWFPKTTFTSESDYQAVLNVITNRVAQFERVEMKPEVEQTQVVERGRK